MNETRLRARLGVRTTWTLHEGSTYMEAYGHVPLHPRDCEHVNLDTLRDSYTCLDDTG